MIKLDKVTKEYGKKVVIEDLSFTIDSGEIVGFIGPNGAGKTTTIKMLTGITDITKGDITYDGVSILKDPITVKKNIGLVPDEPDLFSKFTVMEYFKFIADMYDVPAEVREERVKKLVADFEVEQYLTSTMEDLSHGTKQKMIIIGVLLHNPSVWILDEPMTGLDPQSSMVLKDKMREHAKNGNTVFFSTHVLDVAEKLCTKIIILAKGKVRFEGSLEQLQEKYPNIDSLEKIFLEVIKD